MPYAAYHTSVLDPAGNVQSNVTVTVRRESVGLPLVPVYADRDGAVSLGNPFLVASGANLAFFAAGGAYQITFAVAGFADVVLDYVPIGLSQETDFGGGVDTIDEFTSGSGTIGANAITAIVNRVAPTATALTLPDASLRNGRALAIADMSTSIAEHTITLTPADADQKIMRESSWPIVSTAASRASVTLIPVVDPDDDTNHIWIIAP
jgi:hypothetical protein